MMLLLFQKFLYKARISNKKITQKNRLFLEKIITKNKNNKKLHSESRKKRTEEFNELSRALLEGTFNIKRDG